MSPGTFLVFVVLAAPGGTFYGDDMGLKIDKEFESLIPDLCPEEYRILEQNILNEGVRDSLITWKGILLDGHNRLKICTEHNIEYDTSPNLTIKNRKEAKVWIIRNQFGRRNINSFIRAELALKLKSILKVKAKENLKTSTGGVKPRPLSNSTKAVPIDVRKDIAKSARVSSNTIAKVEVIKKHANNETIDALREDKITIHNAYRAVTKKERKAMAGDRYDVIYIDFVCRAGKKDFLDCKIPDLLRDKSAVLAWSEPCNIARLITRAKDAGLKFVTEYIMECDPKVSPHGTIAHNSLLVFSSGLKQNESNCYSTILDPKGVTKKVLCKRMIEDFYGECKKIVINDRKEKENEWIYE
jgi:hypothetical protein